MAVTKNYIKGRTLTSNSKANLEKLKMHLENDVNSCNLNLANEEYIPLGPETQKLYYELLSELFKTSNEVTEWLDEHDYCIMRLGRMTLDLGLFAKSYIS